MTLADRQLTGGMKTYSLPVIMLLKEEPSTRSSQVTHDESHFEFPGLGPRMGERGRERDLKSC